MVKKTLMVPTSMVKTLSAHPWRKNSKYGQTAPLKVTLSAHLWSKP